MGPSSNVDKPHSEVTAVQQEPSQNDTDSQRAQPTSSDDTAAGAAAAQAADCHEDVATQAISNLSCMIPRDVHDLITANLPAQVSTHDMRQMPPYAACANESTALGHFAEQVLTTRSGPHICAARRQTLGKGGYGVVTLCEHVGRKVRIATALGA